MGQWSLSVMVRPEERAIYRPLVWMLPAWCEVEPVRTLDTARTLNSILNEATMIAALESLEELRPLQPETLRARSTEAQPPIQRAEEHAAMDASRAEVQEKTPGELLAEFRKKKQKTDFFDFLPEGSENPIAAETQNEPQREPQREPLSAQLGSVLPNANPPVPPAGIFAPPKASARTTFDDFELSSSFDPQTAAPKDSLTPVPVKQQSSSPIELSPSPPTSPTNSRVELEMPKEYGGETKQLSIKPSRRLRLGNQKPKMVSEGSVNLVDNSSATQIRHRRVNPTAPRRRPRGFFSQISQILKYLPKSFRPGSTSFVWAVAAASVLVTFVLVGSLFFFFGKKSAQVVSQPSAEQGVPAQSESPKRQKKSQRERTEQQSASSSAASIPGEQQALGTPSSAPVSSGVGEIRNDAQQNNIQGSPNSSSESPRAERKTRARKEMAARQEPNDPVQSQVKKNQPKPSLDILRNADEINKYLSNTSPSKRRFVVVGPLTLVEQPAAQCSPCQGKGRLPDGTLVTLSSVIPEPWSRVNPRKKIYARGMVLKTSSYLITVNAISTRIPR
jgi:hypothetical protein